MNSLRPAVILYGGFLAALTGCLVFGLLRESSAVRGATAFPAANTDVKTEPKTVVGPAACIECHKSEHAQWMKTVHYTNHKRLSGDNAAKYAKALDIAAGDVAKTSLCINCHATPQDKAGTPTAIAGIGVSCESCHGGAGGDKGWLKPHGLYGPKGTTRDKETAAHRKQRLKICREAGKVGPRELYGVAKKCFSCHVVGNEKLVKAGHKAGSVAFEFASWSNGEVRHNFQINKMKNAPVSSLWLHPLDKTKKHAAANRRRKMYVLGLLVDLEVSLRNRANATGAAYAGQMAARIGPMKQKFTMLNGVAGTGETKAAEKLIPPFGELFVVKPGQKKAFNAAADKIAKSAADFMSNHDGSKLEAVDKLIPEAHFSKDYKK